MTYFITFKYYVGATKSTLKETYQHIYIHNHNLLVTYIKLGEIMVSGHTYTYTVYPSHYSTIKVTI